MTCIWEYWGVEFWKHLYIYQEKSNVQNKKIQTPSLQNECQITIYVL